MLEVEDSHQLTTFSHKFLNWLFIAVTLAAVFALGGCKKKITTAPPPPPPAAPAKPTVSLRADPATIETGQSSTLVWQTQYATEITLDGESVDLSGDKKVSPAESATYHLIAKGPGGTEEADARITVSAPPAPPTPGPSEEEMFGQNMKHLFFDYDKYDIRADQQAALQADAKWLSEHPNVSFTIEGHCDDRGSIEYNLALGDNRATAVKNALVQQGVSADRVRTISYGKEKPFCTDSNEECWQQNRRGYFVYQK